MNKLTKHLISILFTLAACVAAGSAGAQQWGNGTNNCSFNGTEYMCKCPSGWTWAMAEYANCTYSGLDGCWNPDNTNDGGAGTCQACGSGGTIAIAFYACFGGQGGQQNTSASGTAQCNGGSNGLCEGYGSTCLQYTSSGVCQSWSGPNATGGNASDIRLKRDIVLLGQTEQGIKLYSFKYLWSDQVYVGVMAQDLLENPKWQDAVITNPNGYYSVIYSKLGLEMVTLEQYQQVSAVCAIEINKIALNNP